MVIPSNDAFVGNLNPRGIELFDEHGFFRGTQSFVITGRDVWDAGTEENAVGGGAAFSAAGGDATDEGGRIRRHSGLADFIGSELPTGETLGSAFASQTPLARITIGLAGGSPVIDESGPTATATADDVTVAGTETVDVVVHYSDPSGVDPTTLDAGDLIITGPLGQPLRVIDVSSAAIPGSTPSSLAATYTVTTEEGAFTARDNGQYSIRVLADEVRDPLGQGSANQIAGTLTVDVGVRLQIEIESLTPSSGLSQTPFWVGFHDGSFAVARSGGFASDFAGLELIAEDGDPSGLVARFAAESDGVDTVITAPEGFAGAPVIEPGEVTSTVIEIDGSAENRFFSFASMVIPSNDAFVGNLNPRRYELFDALGNFRGARQITIFGREVLDAGTEVNDPFGGAAFSTEGGISADENGVIRRHSGLEDFVGTGTPIGALNSAFSPQDAIATITISLFDPESEVCSGVDAACSVRSVSLQNAALRGDVNHDGRVSALDALLIVNFLHDYGTQPTISDEAQSTGLDLDVGADALVSSLDALLIVNDLRANTGPRAEAETGADEFFRQVGTQSSEDAGEESAPLLEGTPLLF